VEEIQFFMDKFIEIIAPGNNFPVKKAVIALGVFDGVHPGHRQVVANARKLAGELGAVPGAVTFVPHPRQILGHEQDFQLLLPEALRCEALLNAGAEFVGRINFSREIANWDAEKFLCALRDCGLFELSGICVGSNWRFGRNGCGNKAVLTGFCAENNIAFIPVDEIKDDEGIISSTRLRRMIAQGELEKYREITGKYPLLAGKVVTGMHIAGKELAAPTANLELHYGVPVPHGVYAGYSTVDGQCYKAVLNIGPAPTYDVTQVRIEIHLLGFKGDLYDREIAVEVIKKLRDIRKFASPQELKQQIARDMENALQI
jgi:riboflavin kinase/FMN adenylyltransferase